MEAAFQKLKDQGKNTVDGIVQWMKDKNVIEEKKSEEQFKTDLNCTDQVDFDSFKKAVGKLSKEQQKTLTNLAEDLVSAASSVDEYFAKMKKKGQNSVDNLVKWMAESSSVDDYFGKMKKEGKNDVDHLVKWMVDSKIISTAKEAEEKARKLFEGSDAKNVDLPKFKEAIAKIAEEQKKTVEDLTKTLAEQGPKFVDALAAGASAFKDALNKK